MTTLSPRLIGDIFFYCFISTLLSPSLLSHSPTAPPTSSSQDLLLGLEEENEDAGKRRHKDERQRLSTDTGGGSALASRLLLSLGRGAIALCSRV